MGRNLGRKNFSPANGEALENEMLVAKTLKMTIYLSGMSI
jgi:hypothetical protein